MQFEPALTLLVLATVFSWPSAVTILMQDSDAGLPVPFTTMIASSVNISCLGLIFSEGGLIVGSLTAIGAIVLGTMLRVSATSVPIGLSVVFLALYLCFIAQTRVPLL